MGARLSSLRSRCTSLWSRWFRWSPRPRPAEASFHHERLPDIEQGEGERESKVPYRSPPPKKRALLVGITYRDSASPIWTPLDGPHVDIEHFQDLLIRAYSGHRGIVFFDGHLFLSQIPTDTLQKISSFSRMIPPCPNTCNQPGRTW